MISMKQRVEPPTHDDASPILYMKADLPTANAISHHDSRVALGRTVRGGRLCDVCCVMSCVEVGGFMRACINSKDV